MILSGDREELLLADLPEVFSRRQVFVSDATNEELTATEWEERSLQEVLQVNQELIERRYIETVLRRTSGRIGQAAAIAKISTRSLYSKMKRYEISKESFKGK